MRAAPLLVATLLWTAACTQAQENEDVDRDIILFTWAHEDGTLVTWQYGGVLHGEVDEIQVWRLRDGAAAQVATLPVDERRYIDPDFEVWEATHYKVRFMDGGVWVAESAWFMSMRHSPCPWFRIDLLPPPPDVDVREECIGQPPAP